MRLRAWWGCVVLLAMVSTQGARAQADYPFRDTKLNDDARIADLLSRLTLEEKVNLMTDHPKVERLGIAFSGQVEGLHGLALGGPGGWGGRGRTPLPTTTFPQEKRPRRNLGHRAAHKDWRSRRLRGALRLSESYV